MPNLPPPAPTSEAPGNFIASALWNASLYNSVLFLASPPIAQYTQTSVQALTTSTMTSVTWPTPTYDSYGGYAAGTPTRYTPTAAGWYLAIGNVAFATNATGSRDVQIAKNGAVAVNHVSSAASPTAGFNSAVGITSLIQCNGTTDYFELQADQASGGNLNTVAALTSLTVLWIHA